MYAQELVSLLVRRGSDSVVYELIRLIEELLGAEAEMEARGDILDRAVELARKNGYDGTGWNQAVEYLSKKAGYDPAKDIPF